MKTSAIRLEQLRECSAFGFQHSWFKPVRYLVLPTTSVRSRCSRFKKHRPTEGERGWLAHTELINTRTFYEEHIMGSIRRKAAGHVNRSGHLSHGPAPTLSEKCHYGYESHSPMLMTKPGSRTLHWFHCSGAGGRPNGLI